MDVFVKIDSIQFLPSCCGCSYNEFCHVKNIIDISPRYQDLSRVPLEALEQINKFHETYYDNYNLFWHHPKVPEDFGPVKNWIRFQYYKFNGRSMFYNNLSIVGLGFMINIKDLRIALYIRADDITIIKYAFDSYDEYVKAKNDCDYGDFAVYFAVKNNIIQTKK